MVVAVEVEPEAKFGVGLGFVGADEDGGAGEDFLVGKHLLEVGLRQIGAAVGVVVGDVGEAVDEGGRDGCGVVVVVDVVGGDHEAEGVAVGGGEHVGDGLAHGALEGFVGGEFGGVLLAEGVDLVAFVAADDEEGDGHEGDHGEHDQGDDEGDALLGEFPNGDFRVSNGGWSGRPAGGSMLLSYSPDFGSKGLISCLRF